MWHGIGTVFKSQTQKKKFKVFFIMTFAILINVGKYLLMSRRDVR